MSFSRFGGIIASSLKRIRPSPKEGPKEIDAAVAANLQDNLGNVTPHIEQSTHIVEGNPSNSLSVEAVNPVRVDDGRENGGRKSAIETVSNISPLPTASFQTISQGSGSLLHCSIPAGSHVLCRKGTLLGRSPNMLQSTVWGGNYWRLGETIGLPALQQLTAEAATGDCLLIPQRGRNNDMGVLHISKSTDDGGTFYFRPSAYVASSRGVYVRQVWPAIFPVAKGPALPKLQMKATGNGQLAICGEGSLFRLSLAPGEEYICRISHLLAWSASVRMAQIPMDGMSLLRRFFGGVGNDVLLCGPGEVFLQSREGEGSFFPRSFGRSAEGEAPPQPTRPTTPPSKSTSNVEEEIPITKKAEK